MRMSASPIRVPSVLDFAAKRINHPVDKTQRGFARKSFLSLTATIMTVILAFPAMSALQDNTTASNVSADANNSRSIAVADLDNDGSADIVVANEDNELNYVYYGDGAGGFGAGVALGNAAETSDSVDLADIAMLLDCLVMVLVPSEQQEIRQMGLKP